MQIVKKSLRYLYLFLPNLGIAKREITSIIYDIGTEMDLPAVRIVGLV